MFILRNSGTHTKNRIITILAVMVVAVIALISASTSASAHVSFTPDGIAYIPYAGYEAYFDDQHSHAVLMFTPDGVNQIELLA